MPDIHATRLELDLLLYHRTGNLPKAAMASPGGTFTVSTLSFLEQFPFENSGLGWLMCTLESSIAWL